VTWRIKYLRSVRKDVSKLDAKEQRRIRAFMEKRVAALENPRQLGKRLKGAYADLWRYRVGDYRIICELRDEELLVLVVRIAHRKEVYR